MTQIAVIPGSFDPVTHGHLDVIRRAASVFDEVHVLVVHNPDKQAMIPISRRVELIESALVQATGQRNVVVRSWNVGLLVDYCTDVGARVIVKGVRNTADFEYEQPMAIVNRHLGKIETMFMMPSPQHAHVSSSLVRQVASLGGDVSPYVPDVVREFLQGDMRPDLSI
ncbi:pantetheine-phosphate adenylyltransferase [Gulosibacter bifidus]|uniref:Phosphopantetheine adenylyltransferase n=1 Tax=Gulosibacter bifidus TaxID=272239 RepID=A0ABW5RJ37_9MICO|nr:pantetheine-phosphate adenylyltransferase [Gulosibacter bifidus]